MFPGRYSVLGCGRRDVEERQNLQKKGEDRARKALRTVTVILGAFVLCRTPVHRVQLHRARRGVDYA